MTSKPSLQERINSWLMSLTPISVGSGKEEALGEVIENVSGHVTHMARRLYSEYEPTRGPYPDFWHRLENWLNNLPEESRQQALFRLLPHLFFVGPRELDSLYRVAFNNQIACWLIDELQIRLNDPKASGLLKQGVADTWFCPITDSMRINAFYHFNHLEGRDYRPDWRSLLKFGSVEKISAYISSRGIKRIVLLEDFVGDGGQIRKAVEWAAREFAKQVSMLVVPLLLCPSGLSFGSEIEGKYSHVRFSPCMLLPSSDFISKTRRAGEPPLFGELREICIDVENRLKEGFEGEQLKKIAKYIPLGWDKMGALIVLYTNCPNNSLPIIFHQSPRWTPLFPRSARV